MLVVDNQSAEDFEEINTVWTWVLEDGEFVWRLIKLESMIAGDTDSTYNHLDKLRVDENNLDVDDVVQIADLIGELANESFPDFCAHAFNCPTDRKDIVKTDREAVSDKSLFLTKKRYIMHLVDYEKERVDKLKQQGVEIVKSDTPVAIKKILSELVELLLDNADIKQIREAIAARKEWFFSQELAVVAKPMNAKTLKKSMDLLEKTGSMKGIPYQVRAIMFYNKMCAVGDQRIMPGDKVKLVYIRHHKSKYIAVPVDMTVYPEWFEEIKIDYEEEWKRAKKKIEGYLKAVGMDVASRRADVGRKLLGFK